MSRTIEVPEQMYEMELMRKSRKHDAASMAVVLKEITINSKLGIQTLPPASANEDYDIQGPSHVQCRQILIKHNKSTRPYSFREMFITRTKQEAMDMIKEFRRQIINEETTFEELACTYSDCLSAKKGGDLGYLTREHIRSPLEIISFNLEVGQLSEPVETSSGIHLILRIN
ncbi:uncharacterized protein LOC112047841 [Bicyclus anynana]|uniref:Peptidyl-prolyl cis-trans isomerase n=1 Tax=Bicyclus anynana TaxID=110368 RepID=A0A6J1NCT7_BICAN|nr:uncharacterized protein LOC112047841 [Bicyclus anynana]